MAALTGAAGIADAADLSTDEQIRTLKEQIVSQREQIAKLQATLESQSRLLESLAARQGAPGVDTVAVQPALAAAPQAASVAAQPAAVLPAGEAAGKADVVARSLAGFRFSGDFRYRLDMQARSGNEFASPLQNVRGRYRVRMNIDKDIDPRFNFHLQLSTGPLNVSTTNDQDMAGMTSKHTFSISEAYVDFHPNRQFSIRGGRMEEVFADNMRLLWDDDVRFNGFQQSARLPIGSNPLGLTTLEFRAGEYILSNPGVYVLAANSPYVAAGYKPGQKVRDANLFHPGFVLRGDIGSGWAQQMIGSVQLYRNANQILLASSSTGATAVVNPTLGLALPSGVGPGGNATTTPGGAIYSAAHFQVAHLGYRLERKAIRIGGREVPAFVDFQGSRNVGAGRLRDAFLASANLGAIRNAGDVRLLYQYAVKDANSIVSQFTDDDLGTGTGVNIAVHAFRFDVGLTRFLQLQNLVFIQNPRTGNDPAHNIWVTIPRGANTTYRYLGQLAFTF